MSIGLILYCSSFIGQRPRRTDAVPEPARPRGDHAQPDRHHPAPRRLHRGPARARLRQERSDHTLNTTGLVHEAYLKLIDINRVAWESRGHFFAMASKVMRRILVNYAAIRIGARCTVHCAIRCVSHRADSFAHRTANPRTLQHPGHRALRPPGPGRDEDRNSRECCEAKKVGRTDTVVPMRPCYRNPYVNDGAISPERARIDCRSGPRRAPGTRSRGAPQRPGSPRAHAPHRRWPCPPKGCPTGSCIRRSAHH